MISRDLLLACTIAVNQLLAMVVRHLVVFVSGSIRVLLLMLLQLRVYLLDQLNDRLDLLLERLLGLFSFLSINSSTGVEKRLGLVLRVVCNPHTSLT